MASLFIAQLGGQCGIQPSRVNSQGAILAPIRPSRALITKRQSIYQSERASRGTILTMASAVTAKSVSGRMQELKEAGRYVSRPIAACDD